MDGVGSGVSTDLGASPSKYVESMCPWQSFGNSDRLICLHVHLCLCNSHSPTLYHTQFRTPMLTQAYQLSSHLMLIWHCVSARSMSHTCRTQQHMTHECWHMANWLLLLYTVSTGGGLVYEVCGGGWGDIVCFLRVMWRYHLFLHFVELNLCTSTDGGNMGVTELRWSTHKVCQLKCSIFNKSLLPLLC